MRAGADYWVVGRHGVRLHPRACVQLQGQHEELQDAHDELTSRAQALQQDRDDLMRVSENVRETGGETETGRWAET